MLFISRRYLCIYRSNEKLDVVEKRNLRELLEARPSLLNGAAVATINILGYTAMAGIVGAGGLGEIAIRYGLYRFQPSIMWITIVLLVIMVQIFQEIGIKVVNKYDNRIS